MTIRNYEYNIRFFNKINCLSQPWKGAIDFIRTL